MENFVVVAKQVFILFMLMMVGFVCNKKKILTKEANKHISDLVLLLAVPCVIIQSFQREYSSSMLKGLLLSLVISAALHLAMILVAHLLVHDSDNMRERILRFAVVFSNAGFMALPLQSALLGEDGVFYGSAFVVMFNIFAWSYGVVEISGDRSYITAKKMLINPGTVGVTIGLLLFLLPFSLPEMLSQPIRYLASLNTPLPMILVGYYIADTDILQALRDKNCYFCLFLRLIAIPVAAMLLLRLFPVERTMYLACVTAISAPVGATITMFAEKFNRDVSLSVNLVAVSTLLSILTMPIVVGIAGMLV